MSPPEPDTQPRIDQALALLHESLTPYVTDAMQATFGEEWAQAAREGLRDPYLQQKTWDLDALLLIISNNWASAFQNRLGEVGKILVGEVRTLQRTQAPLNLNDAYRALDTVARLLRLLGDNERADHVRHEALAVMQLQFQQPDPSVPPPIPADSATPPPIPADTTSEDGDDTPAGDDAAEKENEDAPAEEAETTSEQEETVPTPAEDTTADDEWGNEDEPEDDDEPDNRERGPGFLEKAGGWLRGIRNRKTDDHLAPLELRTRLLDAVEDTLAEHRAKRPLPYDRVTVHILAADTRLYHRYEDAIKEIEPPFQIAVPERLRDAGFEPLPTLSVKSELYKTAPKKLKAAFEKYGPVYVAYDRHQAKRQSSAWLTVVTGQAEETEYRIRSNQRFNVGRLKEVREGSYGHLVRRNDIAFLGDDTPGLDADIRAINNTVSRKHARIEYDERSGQFVLHKVEGDTFVSRPGRGARVQVLYQPITLEDGDLIYLGSACLRLNTRKR